MSGWFVPILLRIILINTIYPVLLKGKIITKDVISRFFLQYLFCGFISLIFALYLGQVVFNATMLMVMIMGFLNGYSAYANWQTTKINLSAMSLFSFLDDVIAISLGYIVLNEAEFFNGMIETGLILCAASILVLSLGNYIKKKDEKNKLPLIFFYHVLGYTVIWGLNAFFMRWFALENIGVGTFVFGWYSASFVFAAILLLIKKEGTLSDEFTKMKSSSNMWIGLVSSLFVTVNICFTYWALALAPLAVVKPIFFVSAMIIPAIVGYYYFREKESFSKVEKLSFPLAIIGSVVIALGFGY